LSVALTPAEAPTVLQASSQTHLQPDSQTRPQLTTPRTRGVVVPFAALRRRSRLWASSAAAAVFVGGVTTALWPQISNQTNQTVAEYNADSTAPRSESAPNAEPESAAPRQPGQPSESAPASRSDSRTDSRTANRAPATNSGPNPSINQPSVDQPAAGNETLPSRSDKAPDTPVAPTDVPSNSAQADLENSSESVAPATPPATNSATANSNPPPSAVAQSREENADAAISTARQSSPDAGAATFGAAAPVPEADTLDQVRAYFQSRWQPSDLAVQPPLSYQLELSAAGEVIGFTALNEAAEESRDRLLPADNPPVFSPIAPDSGSDAGGLTLNIVLTADGQVQVSQP
jgi:hypothetical protein